MKYFYNILRVLTGALFIFSGAVKLNDPSGFSIKLDEYFDVFAEDVATVQDSVRFTIYNGDEVLNSATYTLYTFDNKKNISAAVSGDSTEGYSVKWQYGNEMYLESEVEIDSNTQIQKADLVVVTEDGDKQILRANFEIDTIKNKNWTTQLNSFIKEQSALNGFFKSCKDYSLFFSVAFCALEVILGFALILGWQINWVVGITALLIGFFTFLTFYSAYYNKVTDCGCFGDFLKLKPWDSFKKDVVLSVIILILILFRKKSICLMKENRADSLMVVFSAGTLLFGVYCYQYLPVWDFLPYNIGNDIKYVMEHIPEGERASDSIDIKFVMQKGSDSIKVDIKGYSQALKDGYKFVRQDRKLIIEGYKSPIHDFAIYDQETDTDLKDEMLNNEGYQMMYIAPFLNTMDTSNLKEMIDLYHFSEDKKWTFYALSSASLDPANQFKEKHSLPFKFYAADQKMLMTMARYNPTLYLFKGSTVIQKWSGNNLPDTEDLGAIQ